MILNYEECDLFMHIIDFKSYKVTIFYFFYFLTIKGIGIGIFFFFSLYLRDFDVFYF